MRFANNCILFLFIFNRYPFFGIGVVEKAGNIKIRDSGIAYPGSQSRPVFDVMYRKCAFGTVTTQNLVMANLLIFL